MKKPLALIILDGWGFTPMREGNAIELANTPYYDEIREKFPRTLLHASGERVGLPGNIAGNSESGHLNLGAGRIVESDLVRIDKAIASGEFAANEVLGKALDGVKATDKALHLIGLFSYGEVHSSQHHLFSILRMAKKRGLTKVFVHCILDGRDTAPSSADIYIEALEIKLADIGIGEIATICGRFYAMDRNNNWERIARAYTMLTHGEGERATDAVWGIRNSYLRGVTDEFVEPIVLERKFGVPVAKIEDGDTAICFNFRADRMRQLIRVLAVADAREISLPNKPQVKTVCLTEYDPSFNLPVAFPRPLLQNTLGEVFAAHGIRNLRLAETEKALNVTQMLNGGAEHEFESETRFIVPSAKVSTYDLEPEMAAFKITDRFLRAIDEAENQVFIVNFANPDMLGHTGKLEKAVEAIQYVDTCLGWIVRTMRKIGGTTIITSGHGNCEQMQDLNNGEPFTAHTTNQVPLYLIDEDTIGAKLRENGALEDVAPTILAILGIEKPSEMTGKDLRA